MSPVYTTEQTSFPGAQDGYDNVGTWTGGLTTLAFSSAPLVSWGGLIFIPSFTLSSGDGFGNSGHSTISPIGFSSTTLTLRVMTSVGSPTGTLQMFVVPEANASDYSDALLPGTRNEVAISDLETWDVAGLSVGDPHTFTVNTVGIGLLNGIIKSSYFRGKLAISFQVLFTNGTVLGYAAAENSNPVGLPPTLTTVEFGDHTGFGDNWRSDLPGRGQHDDRFGFPVHTREWERDGYTGILRVLTGDADPEDPVDEYIPRPTEGAVDDEPA